ncbi:MAG: hypothetical protein ACJA0E_001985 [Bermanella sp.]|jgi:hypothetical protein
MDSALLRISKYSVEDNQATVAVGNERYRRNDINFNNKKIVRTNNALTTYFNSLNN